jgi:hypothetical protein
MDELKTLLKAKCNMRMPALEQGLEDLEISGYGGVSNKGKRLRKQQEEYEMLLLKKRLQAQKAKGGSRAAVRCGSWILSFLSGKQTCWNRQSVSCAAAHAERATISYLEA